MSLEGTRTVRDLSGFSMLELFRLEADTQTATLSAAVLAIEDVPRSPGMVESMMRAAHSLKGAARIVGLEPAVRVAHAMEDVFVAAGQGRFGIRSDHADILLDAIDFLASIGRADDALMAESPWVARADTLVSRFVAMLEHATGDDVGNTSTAASTPPAAVPPQARPRADAGAASPAAPVTVATSAEAADPDAARPPAPRTFDTVDRVVRVSADSLTRLVGLAGESLVEARQLRPFVDAFLSLRSAQVDLCDALAMLVDRSQAGDSPVPETLAALIGTARERADAILADMIAHSDDFESFARRNEDLSQRLHHEVIVSRMRPLADGIRGFPRMVRDVARSLGKQVRLDVRGEQTGVDRDILDHLEAPLSHLVRNAIDHGIEAPELRGRVGKPPGGTIVLEARHRAGMLHITITDDGSGIDVDQVRRQAVGRGLVSAPVADRLTEAEVLDFLFLPGFSTKEQVTEISGRGVGLDVVQSMMKAVGGSVRIASTPGRQTVFTLQLPITMSVIRALLVDIGGDPYAFPLTRIDQIVSLDSDDVRTVEGRQYFDRDGAAIGLVLAAEILEVSCPQPPPAPISVVVISDRGQRFGMIVDAFLGERDLEVRPLDRRLGRIPDISSVSLLENGDPVLIVDVEDLVRSIDSVLLGRRLSRLEFSRLTEHSRRRRRILVVDDSITVRELERQLLQARGFVVDVAVDGLDGWNALRGGHYDLVVTDVDMPRLDGIGLVTLIRRDPTRRSLPVVIVSYKDREEDRMRGLEAGADRYLTKSSFHDETFLHTIIDLAGEPET